MTLLKTQKRIEFPILIGDIGGTNARFSLIFSEKEEGIIYPSQYCKHFRNIDQAIEEVIWPMARVKPKTLILAIAGPVNGQVMRLTNSHWQINPTELIQKFGFTTLLLINDFEAQALATTALSHQDLHFIGQARYQEEGTRLILGPGTGLGVAGLLFANDKYIPIPGEGGHIDYAPQNALDFQLYPYLREDKPRLSAEEILSGRGFLQVYKAFCQMLRKEVLYQTPDEIYQAALENESLAIRAIDFFINYLARFAGDLALIFKAEAGVYIGGGIMPRLLRFIKEERFRALFENKTPHHALLAKSPICIMLNTQAALAGMATFVKNPQKFIVETKGRIWHKH